MSDREELHRGFPLESLGRELTTTAREGRLDPVLAPTSLVQTLATLLATGHSPILIGREGVGKTAAVEALAARIAVQPQTVPDALVKRPIINCDMLAFQGNCLYVNEFETRMANILDKCRESKAILFLNQLHLAVRAGAMSGYEDRTVATFLTPYVGRREVCLIGATTPEGYCTILRTNARFAGCLTPVEVPEATAEETLAILEKLRLVFQMKYNIKIHPQTLAEVMRMTRFYRWQAFPGKAFLLLKAALAEKALVGSRTPTSKSALTVRNIQALAKTRTGLPSFLLFREEPVQRQILIDELRTHLFEQDQAIEAVVDAILTFKAELNDPERPLASFLFSGPTGVGKTELVKLLAEFLFGSRERVIRYDMGEYMDSWSVARLAGEGRQDGPRRGLVEEVLAQPFSIILFDEVEKAHPSLFSLLLPILGEGRLIDVYGRTASFANTIVIMTSNLGARLYGRRSIGLSPSQAEGRECEIEETILQEIKSFFSPEFLNRLTKIHHFRPLSRAAVKRVAEKAVQEALGRPGIKDLNLQVSVDDPLFDELLERGYCPEYGARPMQRAVQECVVYPLARALASGGVASGQDVRLTYDNGQTHLVYAEQASNGKERRGVHRIARVGAGAEDSGSEDRNRIRETIGIRDRTGGGR